MTSTLQTYNLMTVNNCEGISNLSKIQNIQNIKYDLNSHMESNPKSQLEVNSFEDNDKLNQTNDKTINKKSSCKLFSVSNNKLQAVLSPIKSGIYRKVLCHNLKLAESNKFNTSTLSGEKLETLAYQVLQLDPGKFKIFKNRNLLIRKDSKQHKRFIYKILEPRSLNLYASNINTNYNSTNFNKVKKNIGRPRKSDIVESETIKEVIPVSVTRSGRISKSKYPNSIDTTIISNEELKETNQSISLVEIKDKDYKYYKDITKSNSSSKSVECTINENLNILKRTRKLSSDSQCQVCHKILLGKRMKKHYEAFPDHNIKNLAKAQSSVYDLSLYKFLVNKIKLISNDDNDQKTDVFLNELSDLIEQIQSRNSKLVQNTSGVHFVSTKLSKILGIPEGQYSININAIESVPDPILPAEEIIPLRPLAPPQPRLADYNLSISLDDTITAKLNLSDNIIPSEESLLRTVDDLVHQNSSKTTVIHYDHASDNAVEALNIKGTNQQPILDLSLDLFQFRSN